MNSNDMNRIRAALSHPHRIVEGWGFCEIEQVPGYHRFSQTAWVEIDGERVQLRLVGGPDHTDVVKATPKAALDALKAQKRARRIEFEEVLTTPEEDFGASRRGKSSGEPV